MVKIKKLMIKTPIYLLFIVLICCSSRCNNSGDIKSTCQNEDTLALEATCYSATILIQNAPFPNPVIVGTNLSISMKIAAIANPLALLPVNISTKVFNLNGQIVANVNSNQVQSSSSYQNVTIWPNVNVAAGTYFIEITLDAGQCGKKKLCLDNYKIIVN